MPQEMHTVEMPDGSKQLYQDRVVIAVLNNVANASGSNSVATTISSLNLPVDSSGNPLYGVQVTPGQDAAVAVTSKTQTGFTVTLYASSVAAGTFDVLITA